MTYIQVTALPSAEWEPLFVAKEIKLIVMAFCLHCGTVLYIYHSVFSFKPASRGS